MRDAQRDVEAFHRLCGLSIGDFREPALRDVDLRIDLIDEEFTELKKAVAAGDLVAAVDALIDIVYVTVGAGVTWGVDMREFWAEVQRTNMAKAPDGVVRRREDGKILKPEGWKPPDLARLLEAQRRPHRWVVDQDETYCKASGCEAHPDYAVAPCPWRRDA